MCACVVGNVYPSPLDGVLHVPVTSDLCTATSFNPTPICRGKVIGLSVCLSVIVITTKIARSRHLGT